MQLALVGDHPHWPSPRNHSIILSRDKNFGYLNHRNAISKSPVEQLWVAAPRQSHHLKQWKSLVKQVLLSLLTKQVVNHATMRL